MKVVYVVCDIDSMLPESMYFDHEDASARAEYLRNGTGDLYTVLPVAYEPRNDDHYHYRLSQYDPTNMCVDACYNPLCSMRPKHFTGNEFKYWSVESCDEATTRKMADRLMQQQEGQRPPGEPPAV